MHFFPLGHMQLVSSVPCLYFIFVGPFLFISAESKLLFELSGKYYAVLETSVLSIPELPHLVPKENAALLEQQWL